MRLIEPAYLPFALGNTQAISNIATLTAMRSAKTARTPRFHHAGELIGGAELVLSKSASHHLITVLRAGAGDIIELFNGDGNNYRATVIEAGQRNSGKNALLQIHAPSPAQSESPVHITLVQSISRSDKMDTILRQCVELGVARVQPLYTRHSAKALDSKRAVKKQEHWQSIVISACEQSGRTRVPQLLAPVTLSQWIDHYPAAVNGGRPTLSYVLSPLAKVSLSYHLLQTQPLPESIELLVGPESGLEPVEIAHAVEIGFQAVSIGPRILRCETAGPACLAVVQATVGDLAACVV